MKKIPLVCLFILAGSSLVLADVADDFKITYQQQGMKQAVVNALQEGVAPSLIIDAGLKQDDLDRVLLVQLLYCAGGSVFDIWHVGIGAGISAVTMAAGYEKSVAECGKEVVDTWGYTPVTPVAPPLIAR
jgi:hypothetical protein